jgi:hypothetical protein
MRTALKDSEGDGVVTGNRDVPAAHQRRYATSARSGGVRVSELASDSVSPRLREALTGRSGGVRVSEVASDSVLPRLREAPTERSEGVR